MSGCRPRCAAASFSGVRSRRARTMVISYFIALISYLPITVEDQSAIRRPVSEIIHAPRMKVTAGSRSEHGHTGRRVHLLVAPSPGLASATVVRPAYSAEWPNRLSLPTWAYGHELQERLPRAQPANPFGCCRHQECGIAGEVRCGR